MARIEPLEKPYPARAAAFLEGSMPKWAGLEPIELFRIWARHPEMALALQPLGSFILSQGTLPDEDRELIILRACARCSAEYEWGIHAVGHARRSGLSDEAIAATVNGSPKSKCFDEKQRLLIQFVDSLHEHATLDTATWQAMAKIYEDRQLLELLLVTGFYHFVSFSVNTLEIEPEEWAARFPSNA